MSDRDKYRGIIPAFYACYDDAGEVSEARTRALARWLAEKGVKGLYLCGSSGECIYQSIAERKHILEWVTDEVGGRLTIIAHVAAGSTRDSEELARHARALNVDAVAAIPPIYFKLPEHSIAAYWNAISAAAPGTDFFIYNIPQLAGVACTPCLLREMLQNPCVAGVKNSSMPVQDIEIFKTAAGAAGRQDFIVFNGPDEQYLAGRAMGADGGIGGTYAVMPELFLAIDAALAAGGVETAREIQYAVNAVIGTLAQCSGNLYAALKGVLRLQGLEVGGVRGPLSPLAGEDAQLVQKAHGLIEAAKQRFAAPAATYARAQGI